MVQFTPALADAIAVAIWRAEADGSAARHRGYFWGTGLVLSLLIAAVSVAGFTLATLTPWRTPVLIALVVAAVAWTLIMLAAPGLGHSWSDRHAARAAGRDFIAGGPIELWLDPEGLNLRRDGVHSHLLWRGVTEVLDTGGPYVVITAYGSEVILPRSEGCEQVVALIQQVLAHTAAPPFAPPGLPPRPAPARSADAVITVDAADHVALALDAASRHPRRHARLEYIATITGRGLVLGALAGVVIDIGLSGFPMIIAITVVAVTAAIGGAAAWLIGERLFQRVTHRDCARQAAEELTACGTQRTLWLDRTHLGWADALRAEEAGWSSVHWTAAPQHWFIHTADPAVSVVVPRRCGSDAEAFIAGVGHWQRAAERAA